MKRRFLDQSGISLVELLLTISIVSILSIVVMNFMVNWFEQNSITQTRAALLANSQDALDIIVDDIRLSSAADENNRYQDPYSPGAPNDQLSWQSGANVLVLANAAEDEAGNILFSDPSKYSSHKNSLIYFVKNGNLYRRTQAAPVAGNKKTTTCPEAQSSSTCPKDRRLAKNVTSFIVRYLDAQNQEVIPVNARSIEVTLNARKKVAQQTIDASDTVRMVFRNE